MNLTTEETHVWINGGRKKLFLLDKSSGAFRSYPQCRPTPIFGAGVGYRCARRLVAVYLDSVNIDGPLVLQIGAERYLLDGETVAFYVRSLGGLRSRLRVERGMSHAEISRNTISRAVMQRIDPAYDGLDEAFDDPLKDIAEVVKSRKRQERIREISDPVGGPWHLVASS
jgi:hypothetical protein